VKSKFPYYHGATPVIFKNAKILRKNQTPAEAFLWTILRRKSLKKLKFRRQHPVNRFIVDFYCHELKLVIELDGDIHLPEEIKTYDLKREELLRSMGLTVIRFTNEQVFREPERIIKTVLEFCPA